MNRPGLLVEDLDVSHGNLTLTGMFFKFRI